MQRVINHTSQGENSRRDKGCQWGYLQTGKGCFGATPWVGGWKVGREQFAKGSFCSEAQGHLGVDLLYCDGRGLLIYPPPSSASPSIQGQSPGSLGQACNIPGKGGAEELVQGSTRARGTAISTSLFLEIPHTLGVWQESGMCFIRTICLSWSFCINQPIVRCLCLDHSG